MIVVDELESKNVIIVRVPLWPLERKLSPFNPHQKLLNLARVAKTPLVS
jgi:hypothetical protein